MLKCISFILSPSDLWSSSYKMYTFITLSILIGIALASTPTVENTCSNPLVNINSLAISGNTISKDATMKIKYTVSKEFSKSDVLVVNLKIYKSVWFWIPIPSFIFEKVVQNIQFQDGVKHISGRQFEVDCRGVSDIMPVCPPTKGDNNLEYSFKDIFEKAEKVKENAGVALGAALSWFASGDYKIVADVKLGPTSSMPGTQLSCIEMVVEIDV